MRLWKTVLLVLLAAGLLFVVCGWDYRLKTVVYTVESDEITTGLRVACITDLHCCNWGEGQRKLLDAVDAAAPDLVVLVGDILDDTMPQAQAFWQPPWAVPGIWNTMSSATATRLPSPTAL